jgi:maltose/maltodextrin transport system substrate-binding protein
MKEEYLTPIRPGIPGKSPFWNGHAFRFMYVPSFGLSEVKGAESYRFVCKTEEGDEYAFTSHEPWAPLTPVWEQIPVGNISLTVEGLDAAGDAVGTAGSRTFYRAAGFSGSSRAPACGYAESARRALDYLYSRPHYQRWLTQGDPDPAYELYCYPSKIVGAVIRSMAIYSEVCEKPDALDIAVRAAEYLIGISEPAGAPFEFFPPTYADDRETDRYMDKGQIMMIYPAEAAAAYLRLHDARPENRFLEAAERIADTYVMHQLPSGSWPLKTMTATGERASDNECMPTGIISLFEKLITGHGRSRFAQSRDAAFQWMCDNPLRDFHWEGQFEDSPLSKDYSNLAKGHATAVACYLLDHTGDDAGYADLAEEILRFAEDQFVVWERPAPDHTCDPPSWITPCSLEQYKCYIPIGASTAIMISAWVKAHSVTGKDIYIEKARAMADTVTVVQDTETGRYPTYWYTEALGKEGWINCATYVASTMLEFDEYLLGLE